MGGFERLEHWDSLVFYNNNFFPFETQLFLCMHSCHSYSVEISLNCNLTGRGNLSLLPVKWCKYLNYEHGILVRIMLFCFRKVTKCILVKNKSLTFFLGAIGILSSFLGMTARVVGFFVNWERFPIFCTICSLPVLACFKNLDPSC